MGFGIKSMFEELISVIESDKKDKNKYTELVKKIYEAKDYAKECGQLN